MSAGVVHVVDDDSALRESLEFLLESAGLRVRSYDSADSLLAQVGSLEPGCIVTDVRMPAGIELVGKLKELHVPHAVIVLTGHADVPLAVEAMKAGVVDFIERPFDDETLIASIRSALAAGGGAGRQAELAELQARLAQLTAR